MRDNRFDFEKQWDAIIERHNRELDEYNKQPRPVYVSYDDQLKAIVKRYSK